jgi:hypothetical protein
VQHSGDPTNTPFELGVAIGRLAFGVAPTLVLLPALAFLLYVLLQLLQPPSHVIEVLLGLTQPALSHVFPGAGLSSHVCTTSAITTSPVTVDAHR